jgi:DNA-binding response OmpR family regulator
VAFKEFSMIKVRPKSTQAAYASQGRLLYCEVNGSVLAAQSRIFEQAGYIVERAHSRAAADQALRNGNYDVVVLGHTLTKDDRHHLPYMAKKAGSDTQVMVLHASGKHPAVDIALDSREGEQAMIAALRLLAEQKDLVAI